MPGWVTPADSDDLPVFIDVTLLVLHIYLNLQIITHTCGTSMNLCTPSIDFGGTSSVLPKALLDPVSMEGPPCHAVLPDSTGVMFRSHLEA
jgi:hypothetical protein